MLRSYAHALLALVVALSCLTDISLARAPKTSLKLLGQWSPPGIAPGTEQVAYDDVEKVAYLIGNKDIYVIDLSPEKLLEDGVAASPPRDLQLLKTLTQPTTVNDVAFCGDYLAVSANGATKVLPGSVTIFRRYRTIEDGDEASDSLEKLANFTVGALPDQLAFSVDCKTILTSNEGEPEDYNPASLAKDPEGSVSVINLRFCEDEHHHRRAYKSHDGPGYAMNEGDKGQTESTEETQYGSKPGHREHYPSSGDEGYKHHGPHGHKKHHYGDESDDVPVPECDGKPIAGVVRTARFTAWNDKSDALVAMGIKLDGINATVAQDLEPECTAFSHDERIAFVSLQENNAVAVLDVRKAVIRSIHGLGFKDHSFAPNALDASDRDGPGTAPNNRTAAILKNWPLFGMYQPDEIKAYSYKGEDYFVAANEGDARDYPGLREDSTRVADIGAGKLDATAFPNAADLVKLPNMGRLRVLTVNGAPYQPFSDTAKTGNFSKLFSFGARSFTIWKLKQGRHHKASDDTLELVFDSGSQLEQTSKDEIFDLYNSQLGNVNNVTFDIRSPAKGPEPEGLIIAPCAGGDYEARPYYGDYHAPQHRHEYNSEPETEYGDEKEPRICLYLGTERTSVVFVYDITNPYKPAFQSFARPPTAPTTAAFGDAAGRRLSAPEGLTYAKYHLKGRSLGMVLVAYEADSDKQYPGGLGVYAVTDLA